MRVLSPTADASVLKTPIRHEIAHEKPESSSDNNAVTTTISTVPTVMLNTDVVTHNMAARLCISFLGHVLFLKNQVPFPIVQLARMPTSEHSTRATKKRLELLSSFDTLTSHLYTTFVALSTALALRGLPEKAQVGTKATSLNEAKDEVARAFFAVVLGPTVGTAKSHVVVGIDGLETKVWGLQEDGDSDDALEGHEEDESDDNHVESSSHTDEEDERDESESADSEEEASESDHGSPPPSRSPSPAHSSDSDCPPPGVTSRTPLTRVEDPEEVRAAERLLSRTLASACAEGDGQGLASEMAPTQIHVLLRAPRRFDHPSWIPRQNLCASMDGYLSDFLTASGQAPVSNDTTSKKRMKANKVQGVWIKSSQSSSVPHEDAVQDVAEEDELIWWSWDGKLVGFTDW